MNKYEVLTELMDDIMEEYDNIISKTDLICFILKKTYILADRIQDMDEEH